MNKYILPAIIIIVCLVLGSYFQSCFDKTKIDKYKTELRHAQDSAKVVIAWADSVNKESNKNLIAVLDSTEKQLIVANSTIENQTRRLATARKKTDSLLATAKNDTTCNNACQNAVDIAFLYRDEADSALALVQTHIKKYSILETRYIEMTNFANSQKLRGDSLELIANNFVNLPPPPDPDKLLGFIKLPSRTTSYILGVLTVVIPAVVIHEVNKK